MVAKKVYVGEFAGSRSAGRMRKRSLDTVKESLKKRGLAVRQARRMVQNMSEWRGFVRGNTWGIARGGLEMPVVGCQNYVKPLKGGNPSVAGPTT